MNEVKSDFYITENIKMHYYEIKNDLQPLILIHAQGVDGLSYEDTFKELSKKYHVFSIDCYGHGNSLHEADKYNIKDIAEAIIEFIEQIVKDYVYILGHSSGGLIAAYIVAETDWCKHLILEDPPFFSCQGERRFKTYNYIDLSTVCHNFINQNEETDFVLYYFINQYAWNLFPEKSREKIRKKLIKLAENARKKHPDRNLKVLFWPKSALSGFKGMNNYDPMFGEAFYDDSFHANISHEELLIKITCKTTFLKAATNMDKEGILMAALSEDDLEHVCELIKTCEVLRFECGHGIHVEKQKEFIETLINLGS